MKLVIINTIKEFESSIKLILKQAKIDTFSYQSVTGYRDSTEEAVKSNWFALEMNETESLLFYVFMPAEHIEQLFELITSFNQNQKSVSKIHIAVVNIEKSN